MIWASPADAVGKAEPSTGVFAMVCMSHEPKLFDEPTKVTAKDGEVVLDGPDGVDVKLTPEAAAETSDRLLYAAGEAEAQQIVSGKRKPR
jgi:hypothetical protein